MTLTHIPGKQAIVSFVTAVLVTLSVVSGDAGSTNEVDKFTGGLDPSLAFVLRAGYWESGGKYGYFRLVVLSYLQEHSVSHAYVQKLEVGSDNQLREVETVEISEINQYNNAYISSARVVKQGESEYLELMAQDRWNGSSKASLVKVLLNENGTHRVEKVGGK